MFLEDLEILFFFADFTFAWKYFGWIYLANFILCLGSAL